jgi:Ca2+-binding RTX toxin-like protein
MIARRVRPVRAGAGEMSFVETLEKRLCLSTFTPVFDPTNFTATAISSNSVRLDWTDNSTNEVNFLIERSRDQVSWFQVASAPRNSQTFNDASVSPSTQYYYRIKAHGKAANSNIVTLGAPVTTPPLTSDQFATLTNGDLSVFGTQDNDVITLTVAAGNLIADLNGTQLSFLTGSVERIHVFGLPGKDRIVVNAGVGNTNLDGGDGDDVILGSDGSDRIDGGNGNDVIRGFDGNDTLLGGTGKDTLWAGAGDDYLDGGAGNDVLQGQDGNDTLFGGNGLDRLYGGLGIDSLNGGHGDDILNP